jgi:putative aldouronate transport system permease protein
MALPMLVFFIVFRYLPMFGITIAFQDFNPRGGFWGSPWTGFDHFIEFFNGFYFWRVLRNTVLINLYGLIFSFPVPILLALIVNEVRAQWFKRMAQTISYLPHFISTVVFCGMIVDFVSQSGVVSYFLTLLGQPAGNLLTKPELFRRIFILSDIWKSAGWGSIIYLAALSGIDQQLYEAAEIDGASRIRQLIHITVPGISPTIVVMLILRVGSMMSLDFERIILLYNPVIYETADVISSYVYRKGLMERDYSFSTAVDFFNSIINFSLVILANGISRRANETSLW